ncbi:MAG TPA: redoxin domain-containing protein [Gammaproteobacteria bacterium]|nr:redoxin domain-containing protein [Gammaproteobacteria bacterium]
MGIAKDYAVIGVASQSGSRESVQAYMKRHGISYPSLLDADGQLARQWGVMGFPASYIIDENQQVVFAEVGFTFEFGLRLRLWFASI